MMIISFKPHHLKYINLQKGQKDHQQDIDDFMDYSKDLKTGFAYTLVSSECEIIGCFGILPKWEGVGYAWTLLGENIESKHFVYIHKQCKRLCELMLKFTYRRIEATVVSDFEEGLRWMPLLGFKKEGLMKKFDPYGRDHVMFSMVR